MDTGITDLRILCLALLHVRVGWTVKCASHRRLAYTGCQSNFPGRGEYLRSNTSGVERTKCSWPTTRGTPNPTDRGSEKKVERRQNGEKRRESPRICLEPPPISVAWADPNSEPALTCAYLGLIFANGSFAEQVLSRVLQSAAFYSVS